MRSLFNPHAVVRLFSTPDKNSFGIVGWILWSIFAGVLVMVWWVSAAMLVLVYWVYVGWWLRLFFLRRVRIRY